MSQPKSKIHARIRKSSDFELHVRTVRAEGVEVIELRDFVPSDKWYGRGVQIENQHLPEVIEALQGIARYNGGSADPHSTHAARVAADGDPNSPRLFD